MKHIIPLICLLFALTTFARSADTYPFTSHQDANQFAALTKEIRCVVCQNQSLYDSNAPLAIDLREKIYRMILEKKSEKEIKDYLVKRYGEFILLRPRLNKTTFILWAFPFLAIGFALLFIRQFRMRY